MLGLASLATGVTSFLFVFVGSRTVESSAFASTLAVWALANTVVLSVAIPLETVAPGLILRGQAPAQVFLSHGFAAGVLSCMTAIPILMIREDGISGSMIIGTTCFLLSSGIWSGQRAWLTGHGYFRSLLIASSVNATTSCLILMLFLIRGSASSSHLISTITIGNLVGVGWGQWHRLKSQGESRPQQTTKRLFATSTYALIGALALATGTSLIMNNGGVFLSQFVDVSDRFVVEFAAAVSLFQAPLMLLNNVAPVMNRRFHDLATRGEVRELRRSYHVFSAAFTAIVCILAGLAFLVGESALTVFIGREVMLSNFMLATVFLGLGIDWASVVPRTLSAAQGNKGRIWKAWSVGLCLYSGSFAIPWSAEYKLIGAPILGGLGVFLVVGASGLDRRHRFQKLQVGR